MGTYAFNSMLSTQADGFIFGLNAQLLFDAAVLAINIFLLFILLSYLLFNPVRNMLKKRQEQITATREETATANEEAKALKDQYEIKLKEADKEAEVILAEARKKALKNEENIVAKAKEEASAIIAQARKEAELEKAKASDDVKKEIVRVATLMAGKMVSVSMDEEAQTRLMEETLREIGEMYGFTYEQVHNFISRHNMNQRKNNGRYSIKAQRQTTKRLCC